MRCFLGKRIKTFATHFGTSIWLDAGMDAFHVCQQMVAAAERLFAQITLVSTLLWVDSHVAFPMFQTRESTMANITFVPSLAGVHGIMASELTLFGKHFIAQVTRPRSRIAGYKAFIGHQDILIVLVDLLPCERGNRVTIRIHSDIDHFRHWHGCRRTAHWNFQHRAHIVATVLA